MRYYVSMHGGEGWEETTNDPQKAFEAICRHWPKVDRTRLARDTYVFPMDARLPVEPTKNVSKEKV